MKKISALFLDLISLIYKLYIKYLQTFYNKCIQLYLKKTEESILVLFWPTLPIRTNKKCFWIFKSSTFMQKIWKLKITFSEKTSNSSCFKHNIKTSFIIISIFYSLEKQKKKLKSKNWNTNSHGDTQTNCWTNYGQ